MPEQGGGQQAGGRQATWDQFGPEYDWPPYVGAPRSYVIASSGRSGSHFLAHLLFQTGQLGSPLEYLHPRHFARWQSLTGKTARADVLQAVRARRTGPTGWFGIKAHWSQFASVAQEPDLVRDLNLSHYIRLTRQDTVAQAVSMVIAKQSGAWISYHDAVAAPRYDFAAIEQDYGALQKEDAAWAQYFAQHSIRPFNLTYEQLNRSPETCLAEIGAFLGMEALVVGGAFAPSAQTGPQRQATALNAQWCEQFRQEAAQRGIL
ncbi:Stf0 family sulfotransferase [Roseobacter sp. N2S]|uniref:Stf0 family sulfotransferase n=1 Tax=Roseobacter sp. N2S TaxID=2663844 RepID=UPI002862914C|nr:Stf0 family sulfotransferase [Roseobacter sp. N2S]MDR6267612.1 LPS sulfotransferase NodH [Roseobacter sp. N2S]